MSDEATPLGPVDWSPVQLAFDRMEAARREWRVQNTGSCAGECIRADIVRALRAIALLTRDSSEYMMVFGIGGPNPCRADPVELPTWDSIWRA